MSDRSTDDRRQFVRMGLAATGLGMFAGAITSPNLSKAAAAASAGKPTYLVLFRPGPSWQPGKPLEQQGLKEHFYHAIGLYKRGVMREGGGFRDNSGGAMLIEADDDAEAGAIVATDPAVIAQIFTAEIFPWALRPWSQIAAKLDGRAAPSSR